MQKLILPINKCQLNASFDTKSYRNRFGFRHAGIDLISTSFPRNRKVYASGDGVVVAAGFDNLFGNVVIVLYTDAYNTKTKKYEDVVFRYFHFDKIFVTKWQKVTKDTVLGNYGSTGVYGTGKHLHLEADTDYKYPAYSPVHKQSNIIKGYAQGATWASVVNPLNYLHCKQTGPDYQTYKTANDIYITQADKTLTAY